MTVLYDFELPGGLGYFGYSIKDVEVFTMLKEAIIVHLEQIQAEIDAEEAVAPSDYPARVLITVNDQRLSTEYQNYSPDLSQKMQDILNEQVRDSIGTLVTCLVQAKYN